MRTPGALPSSRLRDVPGELQLWALAQGATSWSVELEPYEQCRVAGIVRRLCLDPREGSIEVEVDDGTGIAVARWSLTPIAAQLALAPGRGVVLAGVTGIGPDGRVMLDNPIFEVVVLGHGAHE